MLAIFEALRRANLALWARTPVEQRDRFGIHRERGPESYGLTFTLAGGHDRFSIDQGPSRAGATALRLTGGPSVGRYRWVGRAAYVSRAGLQNHPAIDTMTVHPYRPRRSHESEVTCRFCPEHPSVAT